MLNKLLKYMFFIGLILQPLATSNAIAVKPGECATIEWSMPHSKLYIPQVEYNSCKTGAVTVSAAQYAGKVEDAKVGTFINLRPSGTYSIYTSGEKVHSGINQFECWGAWGSTGTCKRIK